MFKVSEALQFDFASLRMLVAQSAACVIWLCGQRSPEQAAHEERPTDDVVHALSSYVSWAPHGYFNAMVAQVQLVYDFAKMLTDGRNYLHMIDRRDLELIASALATYQGWKTQVVAAKRAWLGQDWGTLVGWINFDWTQLNEQLLALIPPTAPV